MSQAIHSSDNLKTNSIVLIFGIPGAGKGTLSSILAQKHSDVITHLAPGDIFRDHKRKNTKFFNEKVRKYTDNGLLVPSETTNELMKITLNSVEKNRIIIVDGYPRKLKQKDFLEELLKDVENGVKLVLNIDVDKDLAMKRIIDRRICVNCGQTYSVHEIPNYANCKKCGKPLVVAKRKDDSKELYEKRYKWTMQDVEPVLNFYRKEYSNVYYNIDSGEGITINDLVKSAEKILSRLGILKLERGSKKHD